MGMIQMFAGISLVVGGILIISNGYSIYATHKAGQFVSPVPLVGGVFLALGLQGFEQTSPFYWLGFIIDYGTIILIIAVPKLLWDAWLISSFKLLHRFNSEVEGRYDDIRLFKLGWFTISSEYDPPLLSDEDGTRLVANGQAGNWYQKGDNYFLEGYNMDRVLRIVKVGDTFKTMEENYPNNQRLPYDYLDGLTLMKKE